MKIILGQTQKKDFVKVLEKHSFGRMWSRDRPNIYDGEPWAWDNGAYHCWKNDKQFHDVEFWKRLWRDYTVGVPYLAACPDLPAEGEQSLEYSMWWIDRLPKAWPWYLVIQDGMSLDMVKPYCKYFKGLFLGGTNDFKKSAELWCKYAHSVGMKFHYGRCGTFDKIDHARRIGADSIDSATPVFEADRFYKFIEYVTGNIGRPQLSIAI